MTLGDYIKKYRSEHDMSMDDFAAKSGLSKSYISMLERNKDGRGNPISPTLETYNKIASTVGVDIEELLRDVIQGVTLNPKPVAFTNKIERNPFEMKKFLVDKNNDNTIDKSIEIAYIKLSKGYIPIPLSMPLNNAALRRINISKHYVILKNLFLSFNGQLSNIHIKVFIDDEMDNIIYLRDYAMKDKEFFVMPTVKLLEYLHRESEEFSKRFHSFMQPYIENASISKLPKEVVEKYTMEELQRSLEILKEIEEHKKSNQ